MRKWIQSLGVPFKGMFMMFVDTHVVVYTFAVNGGVYVLCICVYLSTVLFFLSFPFSFLSFLSLSFVSCSALCT